MKRRGQVLLNIIFAIFIWVAGVMFIPLMEDVIDSSRTGLNCANPALISSGTKLLCLINDTGVIIIIWTLIVLIGSILMGRAK